MRAHTAVASELHSLERVAPASLRPGTRDAYEYSEEKRWCTTSSSVDASWCDNYVIGAERNTRPPGSVRRFLRAPRFQAGNLGNNESLQAQFVFPVQHLKCYPISIKMAKKRKGSSRTAQEDDGPSTDVGESRKRIKTYEDVADSDDEFHMNRDKVLLDEGPDAKRRRKRQEQEEFLEPSDEEVLAYAEPDDRDEDEDLDARDIPATGSEASGDGAEEEELSGWGTSRDALYGADAIETEQDALDEEAEALRLQKKQLQSMSAADYGFDESEWQDATTGEEKDRDGAVVTEVLPQLQIADDMGPAERLKLLKSRYPEFEPLSKEFLELQELQVRLADDAKASGEVFKAAGMSYTPISLTKYRSATAYLGTLTMYFALLTSTTSDGIAMSATKLRDHPVMDSLVKCRELWMKVRSLPTEDLEAIVEDQAPVLNGDTYETKLDIAGALETAHLERQPKKSRAQRHAEAAEAAAEARRAEKLQRTEADLADLDALIQPNVGKKSSKIDK